MNSDEQNAREHQEAWREQKQGLEDQHRLLLDEQKKEHEAELKTRTENYGSIIDSKTSTSDSVQKTNRMLKDTMDNLNAQRSEALEEAEARHAKSLEWERTSASKDKKWYEWELKIRDDSQVETEARHKQALEQRGKTISDIRADSRTDLAQKDDCINDLRGRLDTAIEEEKTRVEENREQDEQRLKLSKEHYEQRLKNQEKEHADANERHGTALKVKTDQIASLLANHKTILDAKGKLQQQIEECNDALQAELSKVGGEKLALEGGRAELIRERGRLQTQCDAQEERIRFLNGEKETLEKHNQMNEDNILRLSDDHIEEINRLIEEQNQQKEQAAAGRRFFEKFLVYTSQALGSHFEYIFVRGNSETDSEEETFNLLADRVKDMRLVYMKPSEQGQLDGRRVVVQGITFPARGRSQ